VRVADIVDKLHRPEWLKDDDRYRIRGDRAAIICQRRRDATANAPGRCTRISIALNKE
jgi:hypothetical protein